MKRKIISIGYHKLIILAAVLIAESIAPTVLATTNEFYENNDIIYYSPGGGAQCAVVPNTIPKPEPTPPEDEDEPSEDDTTDRPDGSAAPGVPSADSPTDDRPDGSAAPEQLTVGNGANSNQDYKGRPILTDKQLEQIKEFQPVYEEASKETKIPWQVFAVIHLRETVLLKANPSNGQGIYQDFERLGNNGEDYPRGPVTDEEFLRQTIWAGNFLRDKAGSQASLVEKGDPDAIKDLFFKYNGQAAAYVQQAIDLGYSRGYEGSPYVMNIADEKRDPAVNKTTWGQIKSDGGEISYPANGDYGAYLMYGALTGTPSTEGECTDGGTRDSRFDGKAWPATGPNAMAIYYQIKDPYKSQMYGIGTILECGCGPSSLSMAVGTLAGLDEDTMNPKIMADFMANNGGQNLPECGSFLPSPNVTYAKLLSEQYGLTFTELGTDQNKVKEAIGRGSLVVVSGNSRLGGHVFLIRGVTDEGFFLVADPASEENTHNERGFRLIDLQREGLAVKHGYWEVRNT